MKRFSPAPKTAPRRLSESDEGLFEAIKEAFQCPLRSISSAQIGDYIRSLDVSPRSKNNTRATIGAFFKFCKQKGWLFRDHDGVELVPKFKEQATDITVFTSAEVTQFLTHARDEMTRFWPSALSRDCGRRRSSGWTDARLIWRTGSSRSKRPRPRQRRGVLCQSATTLRRGSNPP